MKHLHSKSKKDRYFSLIIIPYSKKTKQLIIPTYLPKLIISLSIFLVISFSTYTYNLRISYTSLIAEHKHTINTLSALNEVNIAQKEEIDFLHSKTTEIEEKLKYVSELQHTVKTMVGIEEKDKEIISASRGGEPFFRELPNSIDNTYDINLKFDNLSTQLDKSEEDLSILIKDVEKRLEFLEAQPNQMPTVGRITSKFGYRKNPFGKGREFHPGIDIANQSKTKIKAAGKGVVTYAGYNGGYGRVVIISHGYGYQSIYGHNRKVLVKVGDNVEKGQIIAEMGSTGRSTGTHLHFEIRHYGKPIDPFKVLDNN